MAKKLEGKTAVITGGTGGIGLATAKLSSKRVAMSSLLGGDKPKHVSERYEKLLGEREYRLEWAERIGLGFRIPGSVGQEYQLAMPFMRSLRYSAEGGYLCGPRMFRALGNLPRPESWLPDVLTSIDDPRLDEIVGAQTGAV